jgi:hypothetical protein
MVINSAKKSSTYGVDDMREDLEKIMGRVEDGLKGIEELWELIKPEEPPVGTPDEGGPKAHEPGRGMPEVVK